MSKRIITTAINYTNGDPHIGHCYEAILADVISRYYRLFEGSSNVFFQTGTDEHGQKIEESAKQKNISPQELCDFYCNQFKKLNEKAQISYDHFIRTTDDYHKKEVLRLFQVLEEQGDIYLGNYEGWYSEREETFIAEHDAALTNYRDPVSQKPLTRIGEPSYFFRMSKYLPTVLQFLEKNPDFIVPESRGRDVILRLRGLIEKSTETGLAEDLSISRTRITWGIPIPKLLETQINGDQIVALKHDEHCMYVWMDALLNYYTGPLNKSVVYEGSNMIHIIGKDILWFHAVIWLAFLKALKLPFPKQIYVHDFIVDKSGQKMSKSIGNVVDPFDMINKYGPEAVRFYLLKETSLSWDLRFSEIALQQCVSSELASKLGNLINRVLSLNGRYCEGKIPTAAKPDDNNKQLLKQEVDYPFAAHEYCAKIEDALKGYRLAQIIEYVQEMIHKTNQHLVKTEIWKIKDPNLLAQKAPVLMRLYLEAVVIIAEFFQPVLPEISATIFKALNYNKTEIRIQPASFWNQLTDGVPILTRLILFPV
jgi:methionyl-tRNA synthetase